MALSRRPVALLVASSLVAAAAYLLVPVSPRLAHTIARSDVSSARVDGGTRIVFEIPPEVDVRARSGLPRHMLRQLEYLQSEHGVTFEVESLLLLGSDQIVLELGTGSEAIADRIARSLARGDAGRDADAPLPRRQHLELKAVEADPTYMDELATAVRNNPTLSERARELGVSVERDIWRNHVSGREYDIPFFASNGSSRAALEALLAETFDSHFPELAPPEDHELAFEWIDSPRDDSPSHWRTHYLQSRVHLDSSALANVRVVWNEVTNEPQVVVYFDEAGARAFGDLTRDHIGERIAIMLDGFVVSTPIVQAAIYGGSTAISMGRIDPDEAQQAASDLAHSLLIGSSPAEMTIAEVSTFEAVATWAVILARVLVAIALGVVTMLALIFVRRIGRGS